MHSTSIFPRPGIGGFILSEVLVSLAIFGIMAGISLISLTRMNNRAFLSRCQTGASTIAQNQIDLILSDMPFNPQKAQIPPSLTIGTTSVGTPSSPTLAVYTDPTTTPPTVAVSGWMTTIVSDTGATYGGNSLNVYQATVTVSYKFKGRTYSVTMGTARASDI